jgi:hypothetical protein
MNNVAVPRLFKSRNEVAIDADLNDVMELDEESLVCPYVKCGRVISEPVRLTDLSHGSNGETYFACPHCFSKLDINRDSEKPDSGTKPDKTPQKETDAKLPECTRHIGYLKSRPPNSAIPDECLTCPKIFQCMV